MSAKDLSFQEAIALAVKFNKANQQQRYWCELINNLHGAKRKKRWQYLRALQQKQNA